MNNKVRWTDSGNGCDQKWEFDKDALIQHGRVFCAFSKKEASLRRATHRSERHLIDLRVA